MGANMAVRRAAWLAIGGFDETLGGGAPFRAAEDIDFAYRAASVGWKVAQTSGPRVRHLGLRHGRDAAALAEAYLFGAGAVYMKNIRCGDAYAALLLARALTVQGLRIVRSIATGERPLGARSIPWYVIGAFRSFAYPVDRDTRRYVREVPAISSGRQRDPVWGRAMTESRVGVLFVNTKRVITPIQHVHAAIAPNLAPNRFCSGRLSGW
jgi:hypothetical protein